MTGTVTTGLPGPIEAASAALVTWLADVAGPTTQEPPSDSDSATARLVVWPLELLPEQHIAGQALIRLKVRHLVMGMGAPPLAARMLDRAVAASAAGNGAPEITFEPIALEVWLALRIRPRPALVIDIAAHVSRSTVVAPRVRTPLQVQDGVMHAIAGHVLGPSDLPIPGVRLEVAGTGASTYSGAGGAFALPGVPAGIPLRLVLSGRGVRRLAEVPADAPPDDIVVRFELEES